MIENIRIVRGSDCRKRALRINFLPCKYVYCSLTSFNGFSRSVVITKCIYSAEIFLGRFGQPESDLIGRERVAWARLDGSALPWLVKQLQDRANNSGCGL